MQYVNSFLNKSSKVFGFSESEPEPEPYTVSTEESRRIAESIPPEIIPGCLRNLSIQALGRTSLVSKKWRSMQRVELGFYKHVFIQLKTFIWQAKLGMGAFAHKAALVDYFYLFQPNQASEEGRLILAKAVLAHQVENQKIVLQGEPKCKKVDEVEEKKDKKKKEVELEKEFTVPPEFQVDLVSEGKFSLMPKPDQPPYQTQNQVHPLKTPEIILQRESKCRVASQYLKNDLATPLKFKVISSGEPILMPNGHKFSIEILLERIDDSFKALAKCRSGNLF